MKSIVFIVGKYYPDFSAVGVCINNLADELTEEFKVIVISKKSSNSHNNLSYKNSDIRYINTVDNYLRNAITKKIKTTNGIVKYFFQFANTAVRSFGYTMAILKKVNIKKQDVKAYISELYKIDEKIDVIIPSCLPFESFCAAIEFKKKCDYKVRVFPYLFDKFSKNETLHRTKKNKEIKLKRHIMLEKRMLKESDKILYVDSWDKHLEACFSDYSEKFFKMEHPLLKRIRVQGKQIYEDDKINIVYTGALYKKLRSPLYALKVLSGLIEKDERIVLHFYIKGDCDNIVNSYCERYPKNIINHGSVSTDLAKSAIVNADMLLSIGNIDVTQLPSKIFEYISTGNPVIHFFSNPEDAVINILSKYHISCCIGSKEELFEQDKTKIRDLIDNCDKKIEFEEVEKIYYKATPKYIKEKLVELI